MSRHAVVHVHLSTGKASTVAVVQDDVDRAKLLADRHSAEFKTFVVDLAE